MLAGQIADSCDDTGQRSKVLGVFSCEGVCPMLLPLLRSDMSGAYSHQGTEWRMAEQSCSRVLAGRCAHAVLLTAALGAARSCAAQHGRFSPSTLGVAGLPFLP